LYDEFEEREMNKNVQYITMLKCAKNRGNWLRRFEDISKRCEPSDVVAYFFVPPCILHFTCKLL